MCGIAGIINKVPRPFDYATFCTLGIANDIRGGDSCGVFIDGKYEYGVKEVKLFSSYFQESKLLEETTKSTIALVHCRKASVGNISEKTAQPVVLVGEDDKVKFVVMHNGTIYNYKELAEKYIPDVDITDMTDSQVMAYIFYYKGYEVLNEYYGGGAFVIVDYRGKSPRTLFFRGASKKYEYATTAEPERPLYYCIDKNKKELVFSSIWMYLMALRKDCVTYAFRTNELLEFNGTSLVILGEYKREKVHQSRPIKHVKSSYNYEYYGDYSDAQIFYSSFISVDMVKNVYSYKGKKINGKLLLDKLGKVLSSKEKGSAEVWFFNGVALKNKACYNFLTNLKKETNLSDKDFYSKFENLIRFLSIDRVYTKGDYWYEAISPVGSALFTGMIKPVGSVSSINISSGTKTSTTYGSANPLDHLLELSKSEINFKEIKNECKSLMK